MICVATHLLSLAIGAGLSWLLMRSRINRCRSQVLDLLFATHVDLTAEDYARRVGV